MASCKEELKRKAESDAVISEESAAKRATVLGREGSVLAQEVFANADLISRVFACLPAKDLARLACVTKQWTKPACDPLLWKNIFSAKFPALARVIPDDPSVDWKVLYTTAISLTEEELIPAAGVGQSSFDRDQTVEFTTQREYFWSSSGNDDIDGTEWLSYRLRPGLSLITAFEVEPMASRRCYAPREIGFSAGFCKATGEFESKDFDVKNIPVAQRFELDSPLVAAQFVRLNLKGFHETHFIPGRVHLYFHCIVRVKFYGYSLRDIENDKFCEAIIGGALAKPGYLTSMREYSEQYKSVSSAQEILQLLRSPKSMEVYEDLIAPPPPEGQGEEEEEDEDEGLNFLEFLGGPSM